MTDKKTFDFHLTVAPLGFDIKDRDFSYIAETAVSNIYATIIGGDLYKGLGLISPEHLSYRNKLCLEANAGTRNRIASLNAVRKNTVHAIKLGEKRQMLFNPNVGMYINDVLERGNESQRDENDEIERAWLNDMVVNHKAGQTLNSEQLESRLLNITPLPYLASLERKSRVVGGVIDYLVNNMGVNIEMVPENYKIPYFGVKSVSYPSKVIVTKKIWNNLFSEFDKVHTGIKLISDEALKEDDAVSEIGVALGIITDKKNSGASNLTNDALLKLVKIYNYLTDANLPSNDINKYASYHSQFVLAHTIRTILIELKRDTLIEVR